MKYIHSETGEVWTGAPSTASISNFYLLNHDEKVARGWVLHEEPARPLSELKESKLSVIKMKASAAILSVYPTYKQINASLGIYGEEYKQEMIAFIQTIRATATHFESMVESGNLDFEVMY
jgi:hypothetical protein